MLLSIILCRSGAGWFQLVLLATRVNESLGGMPACRHVSMFVQLAAAYKMSVCDINIYWSKHSCTFDQTLTGFLPEKLSGRSTAGVQYRGRRLSTLPKN